MSTATQPTSRRQRLPTAFAFPAVAVAPLWIGGAIPSAVIATGVATALLVGALSWHPSRRRRKHAWDAPRGLAIGLVLAALTALSLCPLPPSILTKLQPGIAPYMDAAGRAGWRPWSLQPGATRFELAEMTILLVLFVSAAQLPWKRVCASVTWTAVLVSLAGLLHEALGLHVIWGIYVPRLSGGTTAALFTPFVNPNHQAMLFGMGTACAIALARRHDSNDGRRATERAHQREKDLAFAYRAAALLLVASTVLSASRGALIAQSITAVIGLVLFIRRTPGLDRSSKTSRRRPRAPVAQMVASLIVAALVGFVASRRGIWVDLLRLFDREDSLIKPLMALDGLEAWRLSPVVGIGRGAFVDVHRLGTERLLPVLTHLESVPATMLVEWGPVGGLAAIACCLWWFHMMRQHPSFTARLAGLGLFAVALQSTLDFGPDLLGVSAPMIMLAGSLAPKRKNVLERRWVTSSMLGASLIAVALASTALHSTFATRRRLDERIVAGEIDVDEALNVRLIHDRPLDPGLHVALARDAAGHGRWQDALARARAAGAIAPEMVDAWVLQGEAELQLGEPAAVARASIARGLRRLTRRPSAEFANYIASRFDPWSLADELAGSKVAGTLLGRSMLAHHPGHADAIATGLRRDHGEDPEVLDLSARASMAVGDPALALHFARLLRAVAPHEGAAVVLECDALRRLHPDDINRRIELLEGARELPGMRGLGGVEERLIAELARRDAPGDAARARELGIRLSRRDAPVPVKRRRRELLDRIGVEGR